VETQNPFGVQGFNSSNKTATPLFASTNAMADNGEGKGSAISAPAAQPATSTSTEYSTGGEAKLGPGSAIFGRAIRSLPSARKHASIQGNGPAPSKPEYSFNFAGGQIPSLSGETPQPSAPVGLFEGASNTNMGQRSLPPGLPASGRFNFAGSTTPSFPSVPTPPPEQN